MSVNPILIHISNILLNLNREPTQFNNNSVIFFKTKNELLDLLEFVFGFEESLENSNMFCLGSKQLFIDLDFMFTSKDTLKFISQNAIQQYEKDNQHPFISIEDTAFELPSNFDDSDVPF